LLNIWLRSTKFFGRGDFGLLHSFDCHFNSCSKFLTHVSIATIRHRNAWFSTLNLCFSNVAISRHFCFFSAAKQWGTHRAQVFFFSANPLSKYGIVSGEIPVPCDISSQVAQRSSARKSATSFTLRSSVDVFGLPGLGSSFMVTSLSRKRVVQRETVLRSTGCAPQTSRKAMWISAGVKFQCWCATFDRQPSHYPRRL
jgi:hypothetical protein